MVSIQFTTYAKTFAKSIMIIGKWEVCANEAPYYQEDGTISTQTINEDVKKSLENFTH